MSKITSANLGYTRKSKILTYSKHVTKVSKDTNDSKCIQIIAGSSEMLENLMLIWLTNLARFTNRA